MSTPADRLLTLLPSVYGVRDGEAGPLRELLDVVSDQLAVLETDLQRLYDDQFVETCEPWVLSYIGDLLGIAGLPPAPLTPRAEVAHTIAYRRRKGTAALLEQLARDVTGLPARAVECFELLAATQHLNHLRPECVAIAGVRGALRLEDVGGPFERLPGRTTITHTADVRRIAAGRGRYNIPNVAIFLWRLRAHRLTLSPAVPDASAPLRNFRFSPLGADVPLFNRPETEDEVTHLAEPRNVPGRISRRAAYADRPAFYGDARAFEVEGVDLDDFVICDLSSWDGPADAIAVDPVLGRVRFPADADPPPRVTFHTALAGDIGGGEYVRTLPEEAADAVVVEAGTGPDAIAAAVAALPAAGGVVEIGDSRRCVESGLSIAAAGRRVTVRAAVGARPTVVLEAPLQLTGDETGAVVLDGLLVTGAPVQATGVGTVELRHATLLDGLVVDEPTASVFVERCILGPIRAVRDARVRVIDGIVDAGSDAALAFAAPDDDFGGALRLEQVTVVGRILADVLELVSNSLLLGGPAEARRRQTGCVRFSYVPPGSRTPRRHQPRRGAPVMTSVRYGDPGYCQVHDASAADIRSGADDESELGAFHHVHLPRREAHLRARLDEHLRFGLEAGVFHAT
jgi:hypothetical protein